MMMMMCHHRLTFIIIYLLVQKKVSQCSAGSLWYSRLFPSNVSRDQVRLPKGFYGDQDDLTASKYHHFHKVDGALGAAFEEKLVKWPLIGKHYVVPYVNHNMSSTKFRLLEWAFDYYYQNTNIKFVGRTNEDYFVEFVASGGCEAAGLGRLEYLKGKGQFVRLGENCNSIAAFIHELGHTIGLMHEHKRSDRDMHMIFSEEGYKTDYQYSIDKNADLYGPYDVHSIMQYRSGEAIYPIDPKLRLLAFYGHSFFSSCDLYGINMMYPGEVPAPLCRPNEAPDWAIPSSKYVEKKGEELAKWICRYGNEGCIENGECVLRNGRKFPPSLREKLANEKECSDYTIYDPNIEENKDFCHSACIDGCPNYMTNSSITECMMNGYPQCIKKDQINKECYRYEKLSPKEIKNECVYACMKNCVSHEDDLAIEVCMNKTQPSCPSLSKKFLVPSCTFKDFALANMLLVFVTSILFIDIL